MLIGLILNWEKPIFQTPRTKPVKPELGCSQGRCRWVWSNYWTVADRQVPVFSARAGDFETQPPSSCQLGSTFAPRGCPGRAFPRWRLSAICCTWTTWQAGEAVGFHALRVANGRTRLQGHCYREVVGQGCLGATSVLLYPPPSSKTSLQGEKDKVIRNWGTCPSLHPQVECLPCPRGSPFPMCCEELVAPCDTLCMLRGGKMGQWPSFWDRHSL